MNDKPWVLGCAFQTIGYAIVLITYQQGSTNKAVYDYYHTSPRAISTQTGLGTYFTNGLEALNQNSILSIFLSRKCGHGTFGTYPWEYVSKTPWCLTIYHHCLTDNTIRFFFKITLQNYTILVTIMWVMINLLGLRPNDILMWKYLHVPCHFCGLHANYICKT